MPADGPWKLRKGRIEFILVSVQAAESERIIADIFDLTLKHDAEVDLMGPLAVITYGTSGAEANPKGQRFRLIEALQDRFGDQIKIVHGSGIGHSGYVGGKSGGRFNYFIPDSKRRKRGSKPSTSAKPKHSNRQGSVPIIDNPIPLTVASPAWRGSFESSTPAQFITS